MTNPYAGNPFLLLWLPVDVTARAIRRRAEDLAAEDEDKTGSVQEAVAALQDPETRLWHSLFWLWPSEGTELRFDEIPDEAREAFSAECRRVLARKPSLDVTGLHAQAVAAHALALECEDAWRRDMLDTGLLDKAEGFWNTAVESWATLCANEAFWNGVRDVAELQRSPQLTAEVVRGLRPRLERELAGIHLSLATDYLREEWIGAANRHVHHLIRLSGDQNLDDTAESLFSSLSSRATSLVRHYGDEGLKRPESGAAMARQLLSETQDIRNICLLLLPGSRSLAAGILDDIAKCANRLCVAFWEASTKSPLSAANCAEIQTMILEWVQDEELRKTVEENAKFFRRQSPPSDPSSERKGDAVPSHHAPPKVDALHRREFTGRKVEPPDPPPVSHEPPKVDALHRREFTGRREEKEKTSPNPEESTRCGGTPPKADSKYSRESFHRETEERESQSSTADSSRTSARAKHDIEEVEAIPVDDEGRPIYRPSRHKSFSQKITENIKEYWRWYAAACLVVVLFGIVSSIDKRLSFQPQGHNQHRQYERAVAKASRQEATRALWQSLRKPLPPTGDVTLFTTAAADSPFQITAPVGANYFLKLVTWHRKTIVATIFVRAGTTTEVFVPSGTYEVRYAYGSEWYGPQYLFGPGTGYAKADQSFTFTSGNGYTLVLRKVDNGNLRTVPMQPDDF